MRAKLRIAFKILNIIAWTLLLAVGSYLIWGGGAMDLRLGHRHRLAESFFRDIPENGDITEARIYLLKGSDTQPKIESFKVSDYGEYPVFGIHTLKAEELTGFLEHWQQQQPRYATSGFMCHEPPYGFRLWRGGKVVAECTICWDCQNMHLWPMGFWGAITHNFTATTPEAEKLLAFCDARLPYYRPPPKQTKTAAPPVEPEAGH